MPAGFGPVWALIHIQYFRVLLGFGIIFVEAGFLPLLGYPDYDRTTRTLTTK